MQQRKSSQSRKCTANKCYGRITIIDDKYFELRRETHTCRVKDMVLEPRGGSASIDELSIAGIGDDKEEDTSSLREKKDSRVHQ